MALILTLITSVGFGVSSIANFQVQYESTLTNQENIIKHANALLTVIENEFTVTTDWFKTPP